jgi:hypothetical protein
MPIMSDEVGAVLVHLGDARPEGPATRLDPRPSPFGGRGGVDHRAGTARHRLGLLSKALGLVRKSFLKENLMLDLTTLHDAALPTLHPPNKVSNLGFGCRPSRPKNNATPNSGHLQQVC